MKTSVRILLLLTPLIIVGLAFFEKDRWQPPLNPNVPQPVSMEVLLAHNESYQAPILVITHGDVHNKTGDFLFMSVLDDVFLRVNCTSVDISTVEAGMVLYMRGYSYIHDPSKNYLLAVEIHIHVSYSVYLSIPIAFIILIILFVGFKFTLQDFSFSRRQTEEEDNA